MASIRFSYILAAAIFTLLHQSSAFLITLDHVNKLCCNGTIHNASSGEFTLCCGNGTYDLSKALCCDNKVVPFPKDANGTSYHCCNGVPYDYKKKMCCSKTIVDFPKDDPSILWSCCGTKVHDSALETCCNDQLHPKKAGSKTNCCGLELFDQTTTGCCYELKDDGKLSSRTFPRTTNNTECCAEATYESDKQKCCKGKLHERPADPKQFSKCCGTELIADLTKETCCQHKILALTSRTTTCCGDKLYDFVTQLCCENQVLDIKDGKAKCCGKEAYDPTQNFCCGSKVIPAKT